MDDPNEPNSPDNLKWNWNAPPRWRPFSGQQAWLRSGGLRVPGPAGQRPEPSKAGREQEKRAEARAERLHLASLTNLGVIIMGLVLAAVVVLLVLVLVTHH
jgi:hypothetical protein